MIESIQHDPDKDQHSQIDIFSALWLSFVCTVNTLITLYRFLDLSLLSRHFILL